MTHTLSLFSVFLWIALLASDGAAGVIHATHPSLQGADLPRLISAREFYRRALDRWGHSVSPDGKRLAWIEIRDGKPVFRLHLLDTGQHTVMPRFKHVPKFDWLLDSRHVLFRGFAGRNRHLFLVDTDAPWKAPRDLTPFDGVNVRSYFLLLGKPESVMVVMNLRDRDAYDLYEINATTGDHGFRDSSGGVVTEWITDRDGKVLARLRKAADGTWSVQADGRPVPLLSGTLRDALALTTNVPDGSTTVFVTTNAGRDKLSLVKLDLVTGEEEVIFEAPDSDIVNFWIDIHAYTPLLVRYFDPMPRYHFFDRKLGRDLQGVMGTAPIVYNMTSGSLDHTRLVLRAETDRQAVSTYLVDRVSGTKELLTAHSATRLAEDFSETLPIRFTARDGLPLSGYLTLPKGTDGKRLPMVLRVHGGPWLRDTWRFDLETQFLANRGYAVMTVNFRGSTGFGKAFMEKGRKEFGRRMQDDLIDAVDWGIARGYADPEKIAIYGHSYGGYAALMALARTPRKFAAGISAMGVTDLALLVDSFRGDPQKLAWWIHFAGDTNDPAEHRELKRHSPITVAEHIERPLLMFHGARDSTVPRKHFDRLLAELRKGDAPLDYLVFPDEGHVVIKRDNKLKFARRIERFLATHLGGRADAWER